jgi:hypothetical protein
MQHIDIWKPRGIRLVVALLLSQAALACVSWDPPIELPPRSPVVSTTQGGGSPSFSDTTTPPPVIEPSVGGFGTGGFSAGAGMGGIGGNAPIEPAPSPDLTDASVESVSDASVEDAGSPTRDEGDAGPGSEG